MASRGLSILSVGLLAVLVLAAFPVAGQDDVVEVRLVDEGESFAFDPQTVTVEPGTTVRWVSQSSASHTVTANDGAFDEPLEEGDTFEHTFEDVGRFNYYCKPHASFMMGTVVVESDPEPTQSPGPGLVLALVAVGLGALLQARRR